MDNLVLYKWMEELRQQCRFALLGYQEMRTNLNGLDPEKVFFFVHAFLDRARGVSGLLWPHRPASKARGERLRGELKVEHASPLNLASIGQQLDREDERFEDWLAGLEKKDFVDTNLMPMAAIMDFKPDSFHRSLDPDTLRLHLRGAPCDLKPVADELRKLEGAIQSWMKTHQPW